MNTIPVYDEAQRARGLPERVIRKAGTGRHQNRKISFVFAERMNSRALKVAPSGEGQEIYPGEESGLPG
jgi:hypothetical protein